MAAETDLNTAIDQIAANIKAITANPQPTYKIGDKEYEWGDYLDILTRNLARLQKLVISEEPPYLLRTQLRP